MPSFLVYDLCWLFIEAKKQRLKYVHFWGHQPRPDGVVDKACFSQWWASPFDVDGQEYQTAEHWMMAEKARLFDCHDIAEQVLQAPNPGAAKALGRKVRGFDAVVWNERKYDIVANGNLHKFEQNAGLKSFLLGTAPRILVEASPVDLIWGSGIEASDINADRPAHWRGQNQLGFALMSVRDVLSDPSVNLV